MRLFLFFIALLTATNSMAQTSEAQFKNHLDALIYREHRIDFNRTFGVIIGIIEKDSTYIFSYGSIQKDTIILPNKTHVFQLGSLTNVLTASSYWDLQKNGQFQLDEPIHHYLSKAYHNKDTTITFRQLLSHTSGLPRLPNNLAKNKPIDNQPFANYTPDDVLEFYKNYDFSLQKKEIYVFSHIGYALLGIILPTPNNINTSTKNWAQGYDNAGNTTQEWQTNGFQAAIGAATNMETLLLFLRAQIDTPQYMSLYEKQAQTGIRKNTSVGLGWHIIKHKRKAPPIMVHTGTTNGFRAYMAFERTKRRGVIVLSNSEYGLHGLGYTVLMKN